MIDNPSLVDRLKEYISEDGLVALNPNEKDHEPYGENLPRTVGNDNGILFRAYLEWLLASQGVHRFCTWIKPLPFTLELLSAGRPGLYHRNPGRKQTPEALDNYVGIVSLCALHGFLSPIYEILQHGEENAWVYDNVNPENPDLSRWRQGSDVAFYKLCAGRVPAPWELLWLWGGIIQNSFQDPLYRTSETLMSWLRIASIDASFRTKTFKPYVWARHITLLVSKFWEWRIRRKTGGKGITRVFQEYFREPHPIGFLSRVIEENSL